MPEVIEADVGELCALKERLEVAGGEVVAVHRPAVQRREDEVLVPGLGPPSGVPDLRVAQPLFQVPEAVGFQCRDGLGEKVNGAALAGLCGVGETEMLDAPVSGGDTGAREGTLSSMVGGSVAGFERARPLFEVIGRTVVYVGPPGTGQLMKACNQIVVALITEALSEALVLASEAGVAPEKMLQVLSGGLAGNRVIEVRGPRLLTCDFSPGGRVDFIHKALNMALASRRERHVSLPATALVAEMYAAL